MRVALVTGAAGGMGRELAARLADDGCYVAAFDVRDTPEAVELRTRRTIGFETVDVSSRASVEAAVARLQNEYGAPTVLVNCAAVISRAPFLELTDADWERVMMVNLRGTFLVSQVVA